MEHQKSRGASQKSFQQDLERRRAFVVIKEAGAVQTHSGLSKDGKRAAMGGWGCDEAAADVQGRCNDR